MSLRAQLSMPPLTHWGRVTHICNSKLAIIDSDNGLSPDRRQAIISTNAGLLLIGPLGTNFCEILIEILTFSFKKMRLKVSSAKRQPFCLGLNVLMIWSPGWKCFDHIKLLVVFVFITHCKWLIFFVIIVYGQIMAFIKQYIDKARGKILNSSQCTDSLRSSDACVGKLCLCRYR